jgi:hypothetical protein
VHRLVGKPGFGLARVMCGMIVEDQPGCGRGRVGGIEQLEEFDEFAAAMAVLDRGMDLAGDEANPGQQADRSVPLIFNT